MSVSRSRRQLLKGLAAGSVMAVMASPSAAESPRSTQYLTARKRGDRYEAVLLNAQGRDITVIPLPDRGHSFAIDSVHRKAVAFGRQPGFFAIEFDLDNAQSARALALPEGRHYFGHGAYSADGKTIFATENDFDGERGIIGIYESGSGLRLGEFESGGLGPHEVVLMPDGKTLCVANGGLLIHPDFGKHELNRDSMQPSLAYIDSTSGNLVEKHILPQALHQLSIRHLTVDAKSQVWVGCQYLGPQADKPSLVLRHQRGQALEVLSTPDAPLHALKGYIGSMSTDDSGQIIASSSPVGGLVCFWRAEDGAFLGFTEQADGCGIAPISAGHGQFLLSDGYGSIHRVGPLSPKAPVLSADSSTSWDNHFRRV